MRQLLYAIKRSIYSNKTVYSSGRCTIYSNWGEPERAPLQMLHRFAIYCISLVRRMYIRNSNLSVIAVPVYAQG